MRGVVIFVFLPRLFDIVIKKGRVIDPGTQTDLIANVGINDGKICALVAPDQKLQGKEVIDAAGLIVAPGFIDIHSHEVWSPHRLTMQCFVLDGVTTQIGGNCGIQDSYLYPIGDYFNKLDQKGCLINYASYCGHTSLRERVGAKNPYKSATPNQIERMKAMAAQEMQAGALGISFGIMYAPGISYEEILALAKVAANYGGLTVAHARCGWNSPEAVDSVKEMVQLSRDSGIPHQYSHIGSMAGYGEVMDSCLEVINAAQADGIRVCSDIYPYDAWETLLGSAILDEGFFDRYECNYSDLEVGSDVVIDGKVAMRAGERFTQELFERVRKLLLKGVIDDPFVIGHIIRPEKVKLAMLNPYVMICSDGCVKQDSATGKPSGHPRTAGTYARFLGRYVREERLMDIASALFKCSTLPAKVIGLRNKGKLSIGADADVTIFSPDTIVDKATFGTGSLTPPEGIEYVIVNGAITVKRGEIVHNVMAGKPIRRSWVIEGYTL
jgi:N-acyl-D-amino-acid deacylase